MSTWQQYMGDIWVPSAPSGDAGIKLKDDLKTLRDYAPKSSFSETTNPGPTDDESEGWQRGSQWYNSTTKVLWTCVDAADGAAMWSPLSFPKGCTCWHDEAKVTVGDALKRDTAGYSAQPYNFVVYQNHGPSDGNGDTFEHRVFLDAGTYTFSALGATGTNCGLIDWKLDGTAFITGQDWYAGSLGVNTVKTGSVTIAAPGYHLLEGVVNGKNASSTGYFIPLTKYWFGG